MAIRVVSVVIRQPLQRFKTLPFQPLHRSFSDLTEKMFADVEQSFQI